MKRTYTSPSITVKRFECEHIVTELSSPPKPETVSVHGMQDYTTIQKVTHVIQAGSPEVENILQYHVN